MFRVAKKFALRSRILPSRWSLYAALLTVLGALAATVFDASAQDLTKYAASPISVFASSTTASSDGEDGIAAISAQFGVLTAAVDSANNVYFADGGTRVRMVYAGGPVPALLQFALAVNATLGTGPTTATIGDVYTIVNIRSVPCSPGDACGDTGQAGMAALGTPWGLAFDTAGNLYISDIGTPCVRKVSVADGTISTVAGDPLHSGTAYNGDSIPAVGAFLTAPTYLALDSANNLFIADSGTLGGSNLVRRVDASTQFITTVAGDHNNPGVLCSDNVCGEGGLATNTTLGGLNSVAVNAAGDLFLTESNENVVRKVDHATGNITTYAGQQGVACADTSCGGEGVAATAATLNYPFDATLDAAGDVIITDQNDNVIRGVPVGDGTIHTLAGTINQLTGMVGPLTGPASGAQFWAPEAAVIDSVGNLFIADVNNNVMWKVNAPVSLITQTITFNQIPNATYGDPAVDLTRYATTDSGLAITFTCTGPVTCSGTNNATLNITGAGSVTVTANQAGDSTHLPAAAQMSTFTVAKAALTVKADNVSFAFNSAPHLPPFTYSFAGFVHGDTASAVTGTPVLTTTATPTSLVGEYPITVALGTLASANYSFTPANGTLTITGGAAQTITFPALPNVTYGVATFTLAATASSGDPITYTVSGPAMLLGAAVTVTGVGTVTVTANQAGDAEFGPATPVTQSFQVAPAVLNIAAQPATRPYNAANPAFTYVATGFVSADNSAVLSGAPAFTTTAVPASSPGSYPVLISQGTLFASNYTFAFTNSTLTVGLAAQTITFPAATTAVFDTGIPLTATASSGLAVVYTVTGPASISGGSLFSTMPGLVTVTASQPGNSFYQPAPPVVQTYTFQKAPLPVRANNFTIPFGGTIPTFTYTFGDGSFTPPADEFSGVPSFVTAATSTSAPGDYPITGSQGSLVSSYFDFQFINGTLTILPPSSFILTATPASVVIPNGQARQVTITLTPVNDFVGSVTLGCSNLPAGVTCVSSPNTLTTVLDVSGVNPVTATLTISAGAPVASAQLSTSRNKSVLAGLLWLPAMLFGALLTWYRKRFLQSRQAYRLLFVFLMLLGASGVMACGSSSGSSTAIQPGTTTIQVTGAGTSTSGATSASLALSVTIQ